MGLVFLDNDHPEIFPDPTQADDSGLVAVSKGLGTTRLMAAYRQGIFPWMKLGYPPYLWCWYSPNPRMLLYPHEFKISRSLSRAIKRKNFEIRINYNFAKVMHSCANINRPDQEKSWIEPDMQSDYELLHEQGVAHSIEAYQDNELVGGLYGLAIGKAFFGESMFHRISDASKVCMARLVEIARREGFHFIDCQVSSSFLQSLGARKVPRSIFLSQLADATTQSGANCNWDFLSQNID